MQGVECCLDRRVELGAVQGWWAEHGGWWWSGFPGVATFEYQVEPGVEGKAPPVDAVGDMSQAGDGDVDQRCVGRVVSEGGGVFGVDAFSCRSTSSSASFAALLWSRTGRMDSNFRVALYRDTIIRTYSQPTSPIVLPATMTS